MEPLLAQTCYGDEIGNAKISSKVVPAYAGGLCQLANGVQSFRGKAGSLFSMITREYNQRILSRDSREKPLVPVMRAHQGTTIPINVPPTVRVAVPRVDYFEASRFNGQGAKKVTQVVTSNTFFLYQDLYDRLCGKPSERQRLYKNDWLTALVGMPEQLLLQIYTQNSLHQLGLLPQLQRDRYGNYTIDLIRQAQTQMRNTLDATPPGSFSHFPTWDSAGNLQSARQSAEFLGKLLAPEGEDFSSSRHFNLPQFIFGRFCKLIYAAAVGPTPDWDVTARYWNVQIRRPISQQTNPTGRVRFIYHLPVPLLQGFQATNRVAALVRVWKAIVEFGHDTVWQAMTADNIDRKFVPEATFIWSVDGNEPLQPQFHKLGTHPQGFYAIYISNDDWSAMQNQGNIRPQRRPLPVWNSNTRFNQYKGVHNDPQFNSIWACVTAVRINAARAWGRTGGQAQLMGGNSAADIAAELWQMNPADTKRQAEWLHRCAYSFGGLTNQGDPDTAQVAENLVFGTAEANTTMLRYESYIKRVVEDQDAAVYVYANVVYPNAQRNQGDPYFNWPVLRPTDNCSWIAPVLRYWWFAMPNNTQRGGRVVDIPLFGRSKPTMFEVKLDVVVDKVISGNIVMVGYSALEIEAVRTAVFDTVLRFQPNVQIPDVDETIPLA
ncbi:hypothetical protein VNI00_007195 [Paramarasmius palmivorus]|uniref:Capsid protein n=1 Tax=Paramarasmius palmivorus TaxID=297713 RepID=A0AAW0D0B6_9AGAR